MPARASVFPASIQPAARIGPYLSTGPSPFHLTREDPSA
jgi:hypothetical protein